MALELNLDFLDELEDAAFRALEKTADTLLADVKAADVMPYRSGELERETFVEPDRDNNRVSIVSPKEYAHNVYTHPEYDFFKGENTNARGEWFEPWISGEDKDRAAEVFQTHLEDEMKNMK